jgi:D-alanyl-D-alanine carboxypeptidase
VIRAVASVAILAAGLAVAFGSGTSPAEGSQERLSPPLERVAREQVLSGARSAFVYVAEGVRASAAVAGNGRPRTGEQRFRVGSVTKTFTATVVLRLAEEGKLRLGDTLDRYLPGVVPNASRITIRELLNHTSGLANYTDYGSWLNRAERSKSIRPLDVLRFAGLRPRVFTPPGSRWSYSNTNYVALGLVVEKATGRSLRQELERLIIRPLGLRRTELATKRWLPDLHDPGTNPNLPWAAGGIVSNARELAWFYAALLSGRLLAKASLAEMEQTVRVPGGIERYGLGLIASRHSCGDAWGHQGAILDYVTAVEATPDGRRVAAVVTRGSSNRSPDMNALICT